MTDFSDRNPKVSLPFLVSVTLLLAVPVGLLFLPDHASQRAQSIRCEETLKALGQALFMYANDYGAFPPADNPPWQLLARGGYIQSPERAKCPVDSEAYVYRSGVPPWTLPSQEPAWLVRQACSHSADGEHKVAFFTDGTMQLIDDPPGDL